MCGNELLLFFILVVPSTTKARGATRAVLGFGDLHKGVVRLSLGVAAAAVVQGSANSGRSSGLTVGLCFDLRYRKGYHSS